MQISSTEQTSKLSRWFQRERKEWFGNIIGDLWGGAVTTFALLPEVIGFMIAAGIPPYMGLYTTICLTIVLSFVGGRPGLVSAGAGATAMIAAGLIAQYWDTHPEYLFAAVILAGIFQLIMGFCRVGNLVRFIPECVMHGFVNGLAIMIFISQIKLCIQGSSVEMFILIAIGIGIIVGFPFLKKAVPALKRIPESFVAIVAITAYTMISQSSVMTISDMGSITASFDHVGQVFSRISNVFTGECFLAILPTSLSIAFVGLIETMLTARLVNEETKTTGNLNRECRGQGIGNIICGSLGAMPGCAMIAMTVTNLKAGGRGRLSTFVAGGLMAILLFTLSFFLGAIPLAALVAVMFVVCFHTFNWSSVFKAYQVPIKETMTMALTVGVVVATDNLAYGVGVGLFLTGMYYLAKRFLKPQFQISLSFLFFAAASACAWFGWGTVAALVMASLGVGIASIARNEEPSTFLSAKGKTLATTALICCGVAVVGCAVLVATNSIWPGSPWFSLAMLP